MPVYVDPVMNHGRSATWRHTHSCHMWADTMAELMHMAAALGLKLEWLQGPEINGKYFPHFDLTENKRRLAVQYGAIPLSVEDSVAKWEELGYVRRRPPTAPRYKRAAAAALRIAQEYGGENNCDWYFLWVFGAGQGRQTRFFLNNIPCPFSDEAELTAVASEVWPEYAFNYFCFEFELSRRRGFLDRPDTRTHRKGRRAVR